ncbi:hypothetical protein L7F22_037526 [Adiantum nelumboides]|nr:hypothetical protein [Adiantum nelumboides]
MRTPFVGNSLYFVTFIDDFSRFCWVYPLKAKSDVFAIFQHYVSMVENETGCKVQTLRTDRGGEYMSGAFKDFLGKKGIKHQCTMPYTPQQNGVAERKNRSLMEMARCMLKAKSLPHKLWMEAVACATHVLNRCPTRALKTITPYESCYVGSLMIRQSNVYLWGTVVEVKPMVAFDVPHMQTQDVFEGFLPSFVENQESQQVDNFDQSFDQHVTPHDVEKIVRKEQEVLREERTLPKWIHSKKQQMRMHSGRDPKTTCMSKLSNAMVESRKSLTTVQGLKKEFNYTKILKDFKEEFCCNGTVVQDPELGQVIQLQGDQRKNVSQFLVQVGDLKSLKEVAQWSIFIF